MTFGEMQQAGDMAFDMAFERTGDGYDAAVAYQAVVMQLRAEEAGTTFTWLCPCCEKVQTVVGKLCPYCDAEEDDWRDDLAMYRDLAHGG